VSSYSIFSFTALICRGYRNSHSFNANKELTTLWSSLFPFTTPVSTAFNPYWPGDNILLWETQQITTGQILLLATDRNRHAIPDSGSYLNVGSYRIR